MFRTWVRSAARKKERRRRSGRARRRQRTTTPCKVAIVDQDPAAICTTLAAMEYFRSTRSRQKAAARAATCDGAMLACRWDGNRGSGRHAAPGFGGDTAPPMSSLSPLAFSLLSCRALRGVTGRCESAVGRARDNHGQTANDRDAGPSRRTLQPWPQSPRPAHACSRRVGARACFPYIRFSAAESCFSFRSFVFRIYAAAASGRDVGRRRSSRVSALWTRDLPGQLAIRFDDTPHDSCVDCGCRTTYVRYESRLVRPIRSCRASVRHHATRLLLASVGRGTVAVARSVVRSRSRRALLSASHEDVSRRVTRPTAPPRRPTRHDARRTADARRTVL